MAMTKEERSQRARDRIKEEKVKRATFPLARLIGYWGDQIWIDAGDTNSLLIRTRDHKKPNSSIALGDHMPNGSIELDDITNLGNFIAALLSRYNALVEDANRTADSCKVARLERIA